MDRRQMTDEQRSLRPVDGDPSYVEVDTFLRVMPEDRWVHVSYGEMWSAAVEAWKDDGTNFMHRIAINVPGVVNKTGEPTSVNLLIPLEDALLVADQLYHTSQWLLAYLQRR